MYMMIPTGANNDLGYLGVYEDSPEYVTSDCVMATFLKAESSCQRVERLKSRTMDTSLKSQLLARILRLVSRNRPVTHSPAVKSHCEDKTTFNTDIGILVAESLHMTSMVTAAISPRRDGHGQAFESKVLRWRAWVLDLAILGSWSRAGCLACTSGGCSLGSP